ncbi:MAG: M56 family metallopeptidase, partial [Phycisphaerae bacterium]
YILPRWAISTPAPQAPAAAPSAVPAPVVGPALPVLANRPRPAEDLPPHAAAPASLALPTAPAPLPARPPVQLIWQAWVILAWLAGSLGLLGRVLLGFLSLWWVERGATRITEGSWPSLLRQLGGQLGVRRGVELLRSSRRAMPMTWGLWRTRVLLPADSAAWTPEQRRTVLLHELAHAKRWDCGTQLVVQVVCALYWFNPLVWLAWRRIQTERERACDDLVLSTGTKASAYAEQLLHIAAEMPAVRFSAAAIALARPSKLEGRLLAILDGTRNRKSLTMATLVFAMLLGLTLVLPLAALRAQVAQTEIQQVVAEIERWGGRIVERDIKTPDQPIMVVDLTKTAVTDNRLEHLKGLIQLKALYLGDTKVSDAGLEHLKGLHQLKSLYLGGTKVTDGGLEHLKGLNQLEELYLSKTAITDTGLVHLKGLDQLGYLYMDDLQVTDAGMEHLKGLSQLKWLYMNNTQVTDAGLAHLKGLSQLQVLYFNHTKVTDAGLKYLKELSQLRELHVIGTKVTDQGVEVLQKALPKCRIMNRQAQASSNLTEEELTNRIWGLGGDVARTFNAPVYSMTSVTLKGPAVTDSDLECLSRLNHLEWICLIRTNITDEGLAQLSKLAQLRILVVDATNVTDAGLEHLQKLRQLQRLTLSHTKVSDEGVKTLKKALSNCAITWEPLNDKSPATQPAATAPATQPLNSGAAAVAPAQPAARLDFRIAVEKGGNAEKLSDNKLPEQLAKQYVAELEKNGPLGGGGGRELDPHLAWFEVKGADVVSWVTGTFEGRQYILLMNTEPYTMLTVPSGPRTWGLKRVYLDNNTPGRSMVVFDFDAAGAERFGKLTGANVNRPLAILVDDQVLQVANLRTKMSQSALITGGAKGFNPAQAEKLAAALRNGVTPTSQPATLPVTNPAATSPGTTSANLSAAQVIAEIKQLKGSIDWSKDASTATVIAVGFSNTAGVTDELLEHLQAFTGLQTLYLDGTAVTDAGLAHLQKLSQLRTLYFDGTKVTDVGLQNLQGLSQLQELYLAKTKVTDAGLAYLKDLNQLQRLDLNNTNVTDAGLKHIQGLNQLQLLCLEETPVTDRGLEYLKGLHELDYLYLYHTKVTGAGVQSLQKALPLCKIDYSPIAVKPLALNYVVAKINERHDALQNLEYELTSTWRKVSRRVPTLPPQPNSTSLLVRRKGDAFWVRNENDLRNGNAETTLVGWDGKRCRVLTQDHVAKPTLEGNIDDHEPHFMESLLPFNYTFGLSAFAGDKVVTLAQWVALRQGQPDAGLEVKLATVDGQQLVVLSAAEREPGIEPRGRTTYWLDPERGFMVVKSEDITPWNLVESTVTEAKQVDGIWVPTKAARLHRAPRGPREEGDTEQTFQATAYKLKHLKDADLQVVFPVGCIVKDYVRKVGWKVTPHGDEMIGVLDTSTGKLSDPRSLQNPPAATAPATQAAATAPATQATVKQEAGQSVSLSVHNGRLQMKMGDKEITFQKMEFTLAAGAKPSCVIDVFDGMVRVRRADGTELKGERIEIAADGQITTKELLFTDLTETRIMRLKLS